MSSTTREQSTVPRVPYFHQPIVRSRHQLIPFLIIHRAITRVSVRVQRPLTLKSFTKIIIRAFSRKRSLPDVKSQKYLLVRVILLSTPASRDHCERIFHPPRRRVGARRRHRVRRPHPVILSRTISRIVFYRISSLSSFLGRVVALKRHPKFRLHLPHAHLAFKSVRIHSRRK